MLYLVIPEIVQSCPYASHKCKCLTDTLACRQICRKSLKLFW